jgi:hypothetical protein
MPEIAHPLISGYMPNIPRRRGQSNQQQPASLPGEGVPFYFMILVSTWHMSAIEKTISRFRNVHVCASFA